MSGFICPECGGTDSRIVDSRFDDEMQIRIRRRKCHKCGHRWYTAETAKVDVVKTQLPVVIRVNPQKIPRAERIALEHLCRSCLTPLADDYYYSYCPACREKARAYGRERYRKKVVENTERRSGRSERIR